MKIMKLLPLLGVVLAGPAFSAPFTIPELQEASRLALDNFASGEHGAHAEHLTGYKVWKSGDEARVKIYIADGASTMEVNYTCHKHDDHLECHGQH